ncbi:MAG: hypothetical protein MPJ50_03030 [Pirellulales bacterium]|nr:hypothetical protein [Pirellulales bacterium]
MIRKSSIALILLLVSTAIIAPQSSGQQSPAPQPPATTWKRAGAPDALSNSGTDALPLAARPAMSPTRRVTFRQNQPTAPSSDATKNPDVRPDRPVYQTVSQRSSRPPQGLRSDAGQSWYEIPIGEYTRHVTSTSRPEQSIVDWVLRETGYEAWHTRPFGMLSADADYLYVYHTPEMVRLVDQTVKRFTGSHSQSQAFNIRVASIKNPDWRARAFSMMQPVVAQSPGVQAWIMQKEDARMLMAELSRRSDFTEHDSPHISVNNGQSYVLSRTQARSYVQNVAMTPDRWPGYEVITARIDEGFALEFSPLISQDGQMVDAVLKCNVDQVERLRPIVIDVPSQFGQAQRAQVEVPQMSQYQMQERFHWPAEHVLVVSLGVVPMPVATESNALMSLLPSNGPARSDMVMFIECQSRTGDMTVGRGATREASNYHGRY